MKFAKSLRAVCLRCAVLISLVLFAGTLVAAGPKQTVLYNFKGLADGAEPMAGLIFGRAGVLYGTATVGGDYEACNGGGACGVVFTLSPPSQDGGNWTENVLYDFQFQDPYPPNTNLVFDGEGNLYGAAGQSVSPTALFQLSDSSGVWNLNQVNTLGGNTPIFDQQGNLYNGVASFTNDGMVVESTPQPDGTWTTTTLYAFQGGKDGQSPSGALIFDHAGNLYGTTLYGGGRTQCGTVYELSPRESGTWAETVLFSFTPSKGCNPDGGVIIDSQGNLYGTTINGGIGLCVANCGVVFKLSPPAQGGGAWTETILHMFDNNDGANPHAGLVMDSTGALYGTTVRGGDGPCEPTGTGCGTVFHLTPPAQQGEAWNEFFYSFQGPDGAEPFGNVLLDESKGVLYGTTILGGSTGYGTVFQITR